MNAIRKPLRVFVSDKIVTMKAYVSHSPQNDGDAMLDDDIRDEAQPTRWVIVCLISFIVGIIIGLVSYNHVLTMRADHTVWKSYPVSSSGQTPGT
jgi:uncharacterized membrane protein